MKIQRESIIGGQVQSVEFELTGIELERAFNEYQYTHDKAEVLHQLKDLEYNDVPDDVVDRIVAKFRGELDGDTFDAMVIGCIENFEDELEEYKRKWKVFSVELTRTLKHEYTIKARDEDEAQRIFERWCEHHENVIASDMHDEDPEDDTGFFYEEEGCNPDYADITEEE